MDAALSLDGLNQDVYNIILQDFYGRDLAVISVVSRAFSRAVDKFCIKEASRGESLNNYKFHAAKFAVKYQLQIVRLSNVSDEDVKDLAKLTNLQQLAFTSGKSEKFSCGILEGLRGHSKLTQLALSCLPENLDISVLGTLVNLQNLTLRIGITNIDGINKLTNLEELRLGWGVRPTVIRHLSPLVNLKMLSICDWNSSHEELSSLRPFIKLQELQLDKSINLTHIDDLSVLTDLERLSISNCSALRDVSGLRTLTNLKKLSLSSREGNEIVDFSAVGEAIKLETLFLKGKAVDIGHLSKLANLKDLFIDSEIKSNVDRVSNLTSLESLKWFGRDVKIADGISLGKLVKLKELNLTNCEITDVSGLGALSNLNTLTLRCELQPITTNIKHFTDMVQLSQTGLLNNTGVDRICNLSNLEHLIIRNTGRSNKLYFYFSKADGNLF